MYAILRAGDGLLSAYIDSTALDRLLERHKNGSEDATDRIWRLLNLQVWGDLFLAGKHEQRWEGLIASVRSVV